MMKKIILFLISLCIAANMNAQINTSADSTNHVFCNVSGRNIAIPASTNATPLTAFPSSLIVTCGIFNIYYEDFISNPNEGYSDPVLGAARRNTFCAVLNYIQSTFNLNSLGQTYDIYMEESYSASNPAPFAYPSLAVAGPYFLPNTYGVIPGYFGGEFYDHYMPPGIDPDPTQYDGHIMTNFDHVLLIAPSTTIQVNYWDNYLNTAIPCNYDLYTVLLHEMMHVMGWTSAVGEDLTANHFLTVTSNTNNIQSFTKYDENFLWSGDVRFAPGSFVGNKLVVPTATPNIGQLNTVLSSIPNILRTGQVWITNTVSPMNHKTYDGNTPSIACPPNPLLAPGSFLSHLDFDEWSFARGSQYSPGYQPVFVVSPILYVNQKKRIYSNAELRYMKQLGYNYDPAFAASTSLSTLNNVTNQNLLDNNRPAFRNNTSTANIVYWPIPTDVTQKAGHLFPETKPADYTLVNLTPPSGPTITSLTIDTHTILSLQDWDAGQLVEVLPNSLYGIRGVTTGGNNHNCIAITSNHLITYTPPPGFLGRAEFAFQLWDGIEPGARKMITIDVTAGYGPVPVGNELVYNGTFEDATEVKTLSNPNDQGSVSNYANGIFDNELNMGYLFHGGSPYGHMSNGAQNVGGGIMRKESFQGCNIVTGPTFSVSTNDFGSYWNTFGLYTVGTSVAQANPLSFPNIPGNECYLKNNFDLDAATMVLMDNLQTCKYYKIDFDLSFLNGQAINSNFLINLLALSGIAPNFAIGGPCFVNNSSINYTTNQTIPINVGVTAQTNNVTNTNWQHVTANFFYCGVPTRYILFKNLVGVAIDNIFLKQVAVPPPLIVTAVNSSTLFCPFSTATLTAFATNAACSMTYTWLPSNVVSTSIVVTPTSATQSYTLIGNDGCRTASAVVTATPSPAGTFTLPSPICQAQYLANLFQYTTGFPLGGVFSGSGVVSPTPGQYDLDPNTTSPGTYTILYTVTNASTNCISFYTSSISILPQPSVTIVSTSSCATIGQTLTLTATPSNTIPLTYTWQPGNINSNSIVITPTTTTVFTLTATNGSCTSTYVYVQNVFTPITFTNLPTTFCTFQTINYLENYLAASSPTGGTWTGPGVLTVTNNLTSAYLSPTITAGTYTFIYTYSPHAGGGPSTCSVTNQFTVSIVPGFSLSVISPSVTYCANIAVGASLVATANPSTAVNYTWQPGPINSSSFVATPSVNTIYTVTASNGPCSFTNQVAVNISTNCCSSQNYINTPIVNSQTLVGLYAINQNLTILGSVVFAGEFLVAPNVSITVVPGATLASGSHTPGAVGGGLHMRSCNDMWQGITAQNGGKIIFTYGDLIEDAIEAVVSDGCTSTSGIDISMTGVAFNRNYTSIALRNYNQTIGTQPFEINQCVFTCRDFSVPVNSFIWPTALPLLAISGPTNTLASPYAVGSYSPTNLKVPYTTRASFSGVSVENSGTTLNPTFAIPTYYSINVNDQQTFQSINLFDNQMMGIFARNSNVNSYNNVFQNTRRWQLTPTLFALGDGIYAFNDNTGPNANTRLNTVNSFSPTAIINTFYNCHFGIYGFYLFELNLQYQDFRSTQCSSVPFNNNLPGQYGIWCISNRFKNYNVKNNVFQNVRTAVRIGVVSNVLNLPSIPNFGTYLGKITISNNLFTPTIGTVAPVGTGFILLGVYIDGPLGPSTNTASTFYEPGASLRIVTNNFSRVYRASYGMGISNSTYNTVNANNYVTMIPDVIAPASSQFGIDHRYNISDIVNTNTVIGTNATLNQARVSGVYKSMNMNSSIQCNSIVSVYNGFEFESSNTGAFWRSNTMVTNRQGLFLTTNGVISQQGGLNGPQDNVWQNPAWWTGGNFATWTRASFASGSKIYKRNINPYNPLNDNGIPSPLSYTTPGNLVNAIGGPIFNCYPTGPCPSCNPNLISSLNSIATSNFTYTDNVAQAEEINMDLTYGAVDVETTILDSSSTLTNFYSVNNGGTRGAFRDAGANLNMGNYAIVNSILGGINPTTNIENNKKVFYRLYNDYINSGTLTPIQNSVLNILAHQCPFTDGSVVYQARSLYSIVNEETIIYTDVNCTQRGYSYGRAPEGSNNDSLLISPDLEQQLIASEKSSEQKFKAVSSYDIFPNPAVNNITIVSTKQTEKVEVRILDVSGKLLLVKNLNIVDYNSELSFNLLSGIYFVNLINEQGEKTIKKLVIAKY